MNDAELKTVMLGIKAQGPYVLTPAQKKRRETTLWCLGVFSLFVAIVGLGQTTETSTEITAPIRTAAMPSSPLQKVDAQGAGPHRTITDSGYFGCMDADVREKIISFAIQRDRTAFSRMLTEAMASGQCRAWTKGESVYRQESGFTQFCLRPEGETECYWTSRTAVE